MWVFAGLYKKLKTYIKIILIVPICACSKRKSLDSVDKFIVTFHRIVNIVIITSHNISSTFNALMQLKHYNYRLICILLQ